MVHVRAAALTDARGIARVHVESSEHAYAPLAQEWTTPDLQERERKWQEMLTAAARKPDRVDLVNLVAELDGQIIGFINVGPPRRDDLDVELEVYVIHVLPEHRGHGVGGRLWSEACVLARGETLRSMYVATFAELRCCSFYETHGGEIIERTAGVFHGGDVTNIVYRWASGQASDAGRYALRPATLADSNFLFGLKRAAYHDHVVATYGRWDDEWQRNRFASHFDPTAVQVIVAGGAAVGELAVEWDVDPVYLVAIELSSNVRGRGLGTAVIQDVLDRGRLLGRGVRLQVFKVNESAQRLYERLGFQVTGSTDTHTLMLWRASAP